jgi:hypothetical protein
MCSSQFNFTRTFLNSFVTSFLGLTHLLHLSVNCLRTVWINCLYVCRVCFDQWCRTGPHVHHTCTTRAVVRSRVVNRTCGCAVRSSHYRPCGEKKLKFFFVPFRPSLTPFLGTPSPGPKLSFFLQKKIIQSVSKIEWLTRNVFTRYIEDQQTYDSLAKGLP